jgi:TolA-binding protein
VQVGLTDAARLTGKDQSTITRACQSGRLSFTKDESGNRMFDLAELERVYGRLRKPEEQTDPAPTTDIAAITEALERAHAAEVTGLQREIRRLEDQVRLLESQCSQWQGQAAQITRLLTDQREQGERERERQEREDRRREHDPGTLAQRLKFVLTGRAA